MTQKDIDQLAATLDQVAKNNEAVTLEFDAATRTFLVKGWNDKIRLSGTYHTLNDQVETVQVSAQVRKDGFVPAAQLQAWGIPVPPNYFEDDSRFNI